MTLISPETPILVGAGQFTPRELPAGLERGDAPAPSELATEAARAALEDTGVDARPALDSIVFTRIFSDSSPRRVHGHGRSVDPARSVARRIGADPRETVYTHAGGETPQKMLNEVASRIAAGEIRGAMLVGSETLATERAAARAGVQFDWEETEEDLGGIGDDRGFGTLWVDQSDIQQGIGLPVHVYPLFEQAIRHRRGATVGEHLASMGRLFAPFNEVAMANPFSYRPRQMSAEQLADPSGRNGFLGHPYTRALNARDGVDMAAAVVVTSVAAARELGIPSERWVFLHGCGAVRDALYLRDRRDFHSSPGIDALARAVFTMAGRNMDDVQHIDLYSCFPSAVEIACAELGLAEDDPRGLTLTGGLPFFGGPGNNYNLHGIAEGYRRCREEPGSFAWVSGNGGNVTKHSAGLFSTAPIEGAWAAIDCAPFQAEVDAIAGPPTVDSPEEGAAEIETCSVFHEGGEPSFGIVIARKTEGADRGARFHGKVEEEGDLPVLMEESAIGRACRVNVQDGRNVLRVA